MEILLKKINGTNDFLPPLTTKYNILKKIIIEKVESFGFSEIQTPIIELAELFYHAIGNGTDINEKEMYCFLDRNGKNICLRPELTASAVRAYLENFYFNIGKKIENGEEKRFLLGNPPLVKWYYLGSAFRCERPQKGRYRQFNQFGVEVIGRQNSDIDFEIIFLALEIFKVLKLNNLKIKLNSIGCSICSPKYKENLKKYITKYLNDLCDECRNQRYEKNLLRILDCKSNKCSYYLNNMPIFLDYLCNECTNHFENVIKNLNNFNINYSLDSRLVRGLDYYTKTVFEISSDLLGAQNSICGGGRYDNLSEVIGGPSVPAAGFAIGMERLMMLCANSLDIKKDNILYTVILGEKAKHFMIPLIFNLQKEACNRKIKLKIERDYQSQSLTNQLREANKVGANFALILGENELNERKIILRNLSISSQEDIFFDIGENKEEILNKLSEDILKKII